MKWAQTTLVLIGLSATAARAQSRPSTPQKTPPRYIVLATDISGSMSESDPLITYGDKVTALRDDAQMTFLRVLPFVHANSHIATTQFREEIIRGYPSDAEIGKVGPMRRWQETHVSEQELKRIVHSIDADKGGTSENAAMDWALKRITQAQRIHGKGQAILILLTDGDPDNAPKELSAESTLVWNATSRLAKAGVVVYPIIINQASYREGHRPIPLTTQGKKAEELMELVAARTKGKAYRITATKRLLDIFLEILGDKGIRTERTFVVSKHHRTVILIGPSLKSIEITPAAKQQPVRSVAMKERIEHASGITGELLHLARWDIVILRRPAELKQIDAHWVGTWRPQPKAGSNYRGRFYPISDFLLHISSDPVSPWMTHETVQVRARLVDKPKELGEPDKEVPRLDGRGMDVRLTIADVKGGKPKAIKGGEWDASGRVFTSDPFAVSREGRYGVSASCFDHVSDLAVLLGTFTQEFEAQPIPLSLRIVKDANGELIEEFPPTISKGKVRCRGGEQVRAELVPSPGAREMKLTGLLHLPNAKPKELPFERKDGKLTTGPAAALEKETHLTGQAVVNVETAGTTRSIRLPAKPFMIPLDHSPLRIERHFSDRRDALWVGEYHRQDVTISIVPVFADTLQPVLKALGATLPDARVEVFDDRDLAKQMRVTCQRAGQPKTAGEKGKGQTVTCTYRIDSETPISPCSRCVIDLGAVAGLKPEVGRYAVVDPVAGKLFVWRVCQVPTPAAKPGVTDVLYRDRPVRFSAQWAPDQKIRGVRFEVRRPAGASVMAVGLRIPQGSTRAETQEGLTRLESGQTYEVIIHVQRADHEGRVQEIRLQGGDFLAEDPWPEVEHLSVGAPSGADVSCRAFDQIRIPLRATFLGYTPGSPKHSEVIDHFKSSCALKISVKGEPAEPTEDVSRTIHWDVTPPREEDGPGGAYRFEGYALYTPTRIGRASVTFTAEVRGRTGDTTLQAARAQLSIDSPRIRLLITEITRRKKGKKENREEKTIFDSDKWARRESGGLEPISRSLGTVLGVQVRRKPGTLPASAWKMRAEVVRAAVRGGAGTTVDGDNFDLLPGETGFDRDIPVTARGAYHVHVFSVGGGEGGAALDLRTPTLLFLFNGDERPIVEVLIPPSGRLTPWVRQWPFKYRVAVQEDWTVRARGLGFEFFPPEANEPWHQGTTETRIGPDGKKWLIVEPPEFLPPLTGLGKCTGPVKFRLYQDDIDRLYWEHPDVKTTEPWLTFDLTDMVAERTEKRGANQLALRAPARLCAQVGFRDAPELEKRWKRRQVWVFICRDPRGGLAEGTATREDLQKLAAAAQSGKSVPGVEVHVLDDLTALQPMPVVDIAARRGCLRFPPGVEEPFRFAIMAAAVYDAEAEPAAGAATQTAATLTITEWSDVHLLEVSVPKKTRWATIILLILLVPLAALSIWALIVWWLVRCFVKHVEEVGVIVQLPEGGAVLDPDTGNPVIAEISEVSLDNEVKWRQQYLSGWNRTERGIRLKARLRRLFVPERQAWVRIKPGPPEGTEHERIGLICIRSLPSRSRLDGRVERRYSTQDDGRWEALPYTDPPATGERVPMALTYRIPGSDEDIPAPVCVLVVRQRPLE